MQGTAGCTHAAGGEMLSVPKEYEMGCTCSCGSGELTGKGSKAAPFLLQEDTDIFCIRCGMKLAGFDSVP